MCVCYCLWVLPLMGFPSGSVGKESACDAGDLDSILGSGRFARGRHSDPLQYSCLENPMDRGSWWAIVHGVTKIRSWLRTWWHTHRVRDTVQLCSNELFPFLCHRSIFAHYDIQQGRVISLVISKWLWDVHMVAYLKIHLGFCYLPLLGIFV